MIYIGEFREGFGEGRIPISECISDFAVPEKNKLLLYLKHGRIAAASSIKLKDVLTGEYIPGETLYYTDGEYAWRSDLCYYFEKYNFILPPEFISHALAKQNETSTL